MVGGHVDLNDDVKKDEDKDINGNAMKLRRRRRRTTV